MALQSLKAFNCHPSGTRELEQGETQRNKKKKTLMEILIIHT